MIGELNPKKLLYRDGVSQSQRLMAELDPAYINIEDRSLGDFIVFARDFAHYLRFYNTDNESSTNWGAFLTGGAAQGLPQDKWLADLLIYINDPELFAAQQPEKAKVYANPHLALFVAFLKLLETIKTQLNQFTKKHLDLYYGELLGLSRKKPIPDVVNIIIELSNDVEELLLEKGTAVNAGKDTLGKDLVYKIQKDTLITKATVARIKSVFVEKKFISLKEKWTEKDVLASVRAMLNMALGYDTFNPDLFLNRDKSIKNDVVKAEAIKYQLKSSELNGIVDFVTDNVGGQNADIISTWLTGAYRRQQLHVKRMELEGDASGFKFIELILAGADERLPKFKGKTVTETGFLQIKEYLQTNNSDEKTEAGLYVQGKLLLPADDFIWLANLIAKKDTKNPDWATAYVILETTLQKRGILPEIPADTEWLGILASADVKADRPDGPPGRFRMFGEPNPHAANTIEPALGLAISSPRFALSEGSCKIDLCISFKPIDQLKASQLKQALEDKKQPCPFRFFMGRAESWNEIYSAHLQFDDPARFGRDASLTDSLPDAGDETVKSNTLCIKLDLDASAPLVLTDNAIAGQILNLKVTDPAIVMVLAGGAVTDSAQQFKKWYGLFNSMFIEKVKADITVSGIKSFSLQNDISWLDSKNPFQPFGPAPLSGDRLYFSHPELVAAPINSLTLNFEWMNAPLSFKTYYETYRKVYDQELNGSNKEITGNDHFKAELKLVSNGNPLSLGEVKLFEKGKPVIVPDNYVDLPATEFNNQEAIVNQKRYFILELMDDFNHAAYPSLQAIQMLAYADDVKRTAVLNMPYTPRLKRLSAGYTTSFEIFAAKESSTGCLYSINAFGYSKLAVAGGRLIPTLNYAGELYIGLTNLNRQQNLSLLFQLAEGTADPELVQPAVSWSFLTDNRWVALPQSTIVSDTTNGLVNSGIIELKLPAGITNQNTLLGEGLYWLRAAVNEQTAAMPDAIDIIAQSAGAIFIDQGNAADHFVNLLGPGSIKGLAEITPGIKRLEQPFASAQGRPGETDQQFYNRVSERLRHKNRALTLWDYERLVLQQFPEIYKVKCMPGNYSAQPADMGKVDIIVLPNIKGKFAFDQFQPKVHPGLLLSITEYLNERIPPFATVKVRNAVYVTLKIKTRVRIREGFNEEFYLTQLEADLKKFLSPWAYNDDADIIIGGRMYNNVVVNFIAKKPYIDHVATIRLSQSINGGPFIDINRTDGGSGNDEPESPDVVLISAPHHEITLLKDDDFSPDSMIGIGYMEVANDFIIPPNLIIT
ncbi:baseplate J/gp47 family protein [Mucilaginibacter sp. cycad4]|uniref:baseplate J/gp47 family protein n=1 Tax=Mucilaginibacter sp. cycad4 TaxID=3342096 RepID=UPI002AAB7BE3|nr:baseplate J/gp47 family protein [Mucilaginibacter gossypii]WPV01751.1 baseplate J/gp47 family protein [Mucilaginibacter gossypii]